MEFAKTRFRYTYAPADDHGHVYGEDENEALERLIPVLENIYGDVNEGNIKLKEV